jgi:hypothetical protein
VTDVATHTLLLHPEPLAVVRLGPGADIPDWASASSLFAVVATGAETSLVCARAGVPRRSRQHGPLTAFEVAGPLDLTLTGVLSRLLEPLADAQIPVFTVSTFDTDWVLVPAEEAQRAAEAWRRRGHAVQPVDQFTSEGQE